MAKKVFTDESLETFVNEIKSYTDEAVSKRANTSHTHKLTDISSTNAPWEAIDGSNLEDLLMSADNAIASKADANHSHTITASASDDDVVVLTGTNGTNKVTYSASHANSGVTAGTYTSVTVNAKGHVTAGSNPTVAISKGGTGATTAAGALTNLGITATAAELNKLDGVTATTTELNYVDGVTSDIQPQLDNKLSLTGGTLSGNIEFTNNKGIYGRDTNGTNRGIVRLSSANNVLLGDSGISGYICAYNNMNPSASFNNALNLGASGQLWKDIYLGGSITNGTDKATVKEIGYLSGVTSNIQTQLNGKLGKTATATAATKLNVTVIPQNADLNDYATDGVYGQNASANAATLANNPFVTAGMDTGILLEVMSVNTLVFQMIYGLNQGGTYKRRRTSQGVWSDWVYIPTLDETALVKQISSSTANYRALLMGTDSNSDISALSTEQVGKVYKNTSIVACPQTGEIVATKFTGALNGNANTATKATQDGNGNNIVNTYATKSSLNSYVTASQLEDAYTQINNVDGKVSTLTSRVEAVESSYSGTESAISDLQGDVVTLQGKTNAATTSTAGLMSAADKSKLDNIATGANNYSLPTATTTVKGGVKVAGTRTSAITTTQGGTTSGRYYGVELDSNNKAFVNVPWTDSNSHYTTKMYATSSSGTANASTTNGNTYLRLFDDSTARSSINIKGTGAATVTSDANGVITVNATNTTYDVATTSKNGLMSTTMVSNLNSHASSISDLNTKYNTLNQSVATNTENIATNVSEITELYNQLDGKANSSHSHTITANATDGIFNLTGTSGSNAVTYAVAPYTSAGAGKFDTSTTAPSGTTRLNYGGYLYATKLYSGGKEVSVSGHTHSNYLTSSSSLNASKVTSSTYGALETWMGTTESSIANCASASHTHDSDDMYMTAGATSYEAGMSFTDWASQIESDIAGKASSNHTHSNYLTSSSTISASKVSGTYGNLETWMGTTESAVGNKLDATPTRNGHVAHYHSSGSEGSIGSGGLEDIYQVSFLIQLYGNALYFGSATMFYPNYNCNGGDESYMTDINLVVSTKCTIDGDMGKVDAWVEAYPSSSNGTLVNPYVVLDGQPYGTDTGNYSATCYIV